MHRILYLMIRRTGEATVLLLALIGLLVAWLRVRG